MPEAVNAATHAASVMLGKKAAAWMVGEAKT